MRRTLALTAVSSVLCRACNARLSSGAPVLVTTVPSLPSPEPGAFRAPG